MKKTILLIAILLSSIFSFCQSRINFFDGSWDDMLAEARKENMPVFVDVSTGWCEPCNDMQLVYSQEKVCKYINEKFISFKLNAEKGDGPAVAKEFGITVYPSFLFINGKGELIHLGAGKMSAVLFLELSKVAAENQKSLGILKQRYIDGERNPSFLHEYAMSSYKAGLNTAFVATEYFATQKDTALLSTQGWDMIRVFSNESDAKEFKFMLANRSKFISRFNDFEVNYKIASVVLNEALSSVSPDDKAISYEANSLMVLKSLNLLNEPEFFSRVKIQYMRKYSSEPKEYVQFLLDYMNQFDLPSYEMNFFAKEMLIFNASIDPLEKVLTKISERLKKEEVAELMETQAWMLYRLKRNEEALRVAEKALKVLKSEEKNYSGCESLIRLLKKK
ncbi:MAG: thioredoxin family protein [Bacteroidota bacterium]